MKRYEKPELILYGSVEVGASVSPSNSSADCLCDCAVGPGPCETVGALSCAPLTPGTCLANLGCTCDDFGNCV